MADTCTGAPVNVFVKKGTPLTATVRPVVMATCVDATYAATVRVYLSVGTHRVATLPTLSLRDIQTSRAYTVIHVSAGTRAAAARYGRRTGHRYADLKFVVHATVQSTGQEAFARRWYGLDSYLRLPRAKR